MLRGNELLFIVIVWVPTIWALFDALRTTSDVWEESRQNQVIWVVLVMLLPVVGPGLYFLVARPRLVAGGKET